MLVDSHHNCHTPTPSPCRDSIYNSDESLTARGMDGYLRSDDEPHELTCVDMDTFLATL